MKQKKTVKSIEPFTPDPDKGLSSQDVSVRLANGLGNEMTASAGRTEGQIVAQNLLTFFNFVFVVMAVFLAFCGSSVKNMTFLVIVFINAAIGIFQEIRAKRAVDKLTLVAAQMVRTIRDGKEIAVRSDLLVRDDIVLFGPGDQICADGIVRSGQLQVNESLLTGEADAIVKNPGDELLSGSFVVAGRGKAQLTQVGNDSFAAKLSAEAKADPRAGKSEMMRALDKLIRFMGCALIPVGILLFSQQFWGLQLSLRDSAESTVAALVGMIPEGLYLLTSIALAASSLKLTQQRVLVQDMNCIETLARVDVLCVDKTGTITEPVMTAEKLLPLAEVPEETLHHILSGIYGGQEPDNDTAQAILEKFGKESPYTCSRFIPFTSQTKWCGGVLDGQGAYLVGAPEFILGPLYHTVQEQVLPYSSTGYRVLLIARYDGDPQPGKLVPENVAPLGLLMLTSRIRPQAPETFRYFAQQGVAIKVISGDNPATVSDVARRAGIEKAEAYIDAGSLNTHEEFLHAVDAYTVFGRVTPDKKKKLIQALKEKGHTVAMTGDGVNDVLAMKESHCGIAMASGAQAASQVARMVLLDSDFAAMPSIVAEGRRVINNIQRAASLFLVKNIFSLGLSLITLITGMPYPFAPLHMSVIAALTIGVPGFFLAMEPNYERVEGKFLPTVLRKAFPGGLANILLVVIAQFLAVSLSMALPELKTVCTAILAMVGLSVLFKVCQPMSLFRGIVLGAMALGLVGCFTILGWLFDLYIVGIPAFWMLTGFLAAAPVVFFLMVLLFKLGDRVYEKLRHRK